MRDWFALFAMNLDGLFDNLTQKSTTEAFDNSKNSVARSDGLMSIFRDHRDLKLFATGRIGETLGNLRPLLIYPFTHSPVHPPLGNLAAWRHLRLRNDQLEILSVAYGENHSVRFDSHKLCGLKICDQHDLFSDQLLG